ncbi:MAG: hypothetical protein PHF83_06575 [Candidatus Methanomethylophilus sp.]|nr:hypothetical protein [Methanomethylophilus sp.]
MSIELHPCPLCADLRICSHTADVVLDCGCRSCPLYAEAAVAAVNRDFGWSQIADKKLSSIRARNSWKNISGRKRA